MFLFNLPDSILLKFFSYLSIREKTRVSRVCRKWRMLLRDFMLWTKLDVTGDNKLTNHVTDCVIHRWVNQWGRNIKEFRLAECKWVTDEAIQAISHICQQLRCLDIEGCFQVSDISAAALAKSITCLEEINFFLSGITDTGFEQVVSANSRLKKVKLSSRGNCNKMLVSLCTHVTSLRHIIINDVIPFDESEPLVDDTIMRRIAEKFPSLEHVVFIWCCYVTDETLNAFAQYSKRLRTLSIRECHQITDLGIRRISEGCRRLESLDLERVYSITDGSCEAISEYLSETIKSLKIVDTSVTDKGIIRVTEHCTKITVLNIGEYCFNPFNLIGQCLPSIASKLTALQKLKIFAAVVNDDVMEEISLNLCNLSDLSLGACRNVTEKGLWMLVNASCKLRNLRIVECNSLSDIILESIARKMKNLRQLEIYGCCKVSNRGVRKFLELLPQCVIKI